ncbi:MAG: SRPBCC family protein [Proteobacteria bacterium]|nr:SRPBCC family protein [Pseudomonadota bacterium]
MKVQHTIDVDALPDLVWAVTVDVNQWPTWTPTVERAERMDEGPLQLGSSSRMSAAVWKVIDFADGESFTWETRLRGTRMIASHLVKMSGTGTENTLTLEVKGFIGFLLAPFIARRARQTIETENRSLKHFCERRHPPID